MSPTLTNYDGSITVDAARLPLIAGNMIGATGTGQYITRTGRWKGIMLVGSALLVVILPLQLAGLIAGPITPSG